MNNLHNDQENQDQEKKRKEQKKEKQKKELEEYEIWLINQSNKKPSGNWFKRLLIVFVIASLFFMYLTLTNDKTETIPYTQFVEKISTGEIRSISEKGNYVTGQVEVNGKKITYRAKLVTNRLGDDQNIMEKAASNSVTVTAQDSSNTSLIIMAALNFLPFLLLIGFFYYSSRKLSGGDGGAGGLFNIGSVGSKVIEKPTTRFTDVAGVEDAKEELVEVVDFLKNPEKYIEMGARIPKGILLEGEPGTGKTLLAKAVAGESGANFITISGSEFVEMYVGVGASRVRKLFKEAKQNKPAIIFIDEIDAVGRSRSNSHQHGGNDEREQTLNQLLVEMDGFTTSDNIIIIAATNRADVLDSALTRAGRFDRKIHVDLPDVDGRLAILQVHARNKAFENIDDLEEIAKISRGFSGADLENLLNEAAILAVRSRRSRIKFEDLSEAFDKIGMGLGRKHAKIDPETNQLVAYHEAGHALLATILQDADKVHKVTIIPRGSAGGFMMPIPDEKKLMSRNKILSSIKVCYGGRIAEELMLNDISVGAYSDIQQATKYATEYVRAFGMNDSVGPVNLAQDPQGYYISNETNREIELEVRSLLKTMYSEAKKLIIENKENLEKIAKELLEKETITGKEVEEIVFGKKQPDILLPFGTY